MSAFIKKNSEKCYLTQNDYLKNRFGQKVVKLSVNAGLSCPNRDGKKTTGGCTYCSAYLSGDFSQNADISITNQLHMQKEILRKKWGECLYIPYFQAGSNTYAPLETLKKMYSEALSFENTVGISIATRADCVDTEIAVYLKKLSESTYLTVELGLQTIHDKTARNINRCHTYQDFLDEITYLNFELGNQDSPTFVGRWFEKKINDVSHMVTLNAGSALYFMTDGAKSVDVVFTNICKYEDPYFSYSIDGSEPVRQHVTKCKVELPDDGMHVVIIYADGIDENDLLRIACSLESKSEHPFAKAIIAKGNELGISATETTDF
jgi:hypothetical protein